MDACCETTAKRLLAWYDQNHRVLPWRESHDPYRVWVSEIMLQQTRVETVLPYFERFLTKFPDVFALAAASEDEATKAWEGLGYYSRVRNMQKAARRIAEQGGLFPHSVDELKKLPGFGEYTAGAVASIAFNLPVPAVDGNVLRVWSRLTGDDADISLPETKKRATAAVVNWLPADRAGDFNQALMDLGATVCLPNGEPRCSACPLNSFCTAEMEHRQTTLPVKSPKRPRRMIQKTVFVLLCGDKTAVRKRLQGDVLAGMWELPTEDGWLDEPQILERLDAWGIGGANASIQRLPKSRHIFTHLEWRMCGVLVSLREAPVSEEFRWISPEERKNEIALPTAFKTYVRYLPH